jgi:2',3'-cyclic-nucleotide 2'-phosphodiesterase (5'-nucleotidase family)
MQATTDTTYNVTSLGGNQYKVIATTSDSTKTYTFDFDGYTPITDDQYDTLHEAGVTIPDTFICPSIYGDLVDTSEELMAFYAFVDANPYPDDRITDMIASI